jgi:DNA-binding NtrC family response regulator
MDEIGEISLSTQVKLLRVLDSSTFRRVGATTQIHVDVRVLAATNRDLDALVQQGLFRADLYYRLRTIQLWLPPLRERRADIDVLADHFVARMNERLGSAKHLSQAGREALRRHAWPGNVRELRHAIEAAMVVSDSAEIDIAHFPLRPPDTTSRDADTAELVTLDVMERTHIQHALKSTGGRRSQAARLLGISERNLYRKLKQYNLME